MRVVQTLLFVGGVNTLVQTLFGTRLPTVIGGSWAFMVPIISIIRDPALQRIPDDHMVSNVIYYVDVCMPSSCKLYTVIHKCSL